MKIIEYGNMFKCLRIKRLKIVINILTKISLCAIIITNKRKEESK